MKPRRPPCPDDKTLQWPPPPRQCTYTGIHTPSDLRQSMLRKRGILRGTGPRPAICPQADTTESSDWPTNADIMELVRELSHAHVCVQAGRTAAPLEGFHSPLRWPICLQTTNFHSLSFTARSKKFIACATYWLRRATGGLREGKRRLHRNANVSPDWHVPQPSPTCANALSTLIDTSYHNMSASSSPHSSMSGIDSPGARRAASMLFTIPDRFYDFCHFDQKTFFELADWIMEHVESQITTDISIEESLFVFLDVVARGNSFTNAAYEWDHDLKLTQSIFLNVLHALNVLHEEKEIDPEVPNFFKQALKARWKGAKSLRPGRSRMDGLIKIGADEMLQDGLEVSQTELKQALEALNNFIHQQSEF